MHFATVSLGIRYGKMPAIPGVELITSQIDAVVGDIRQTLQQRRAEIDYDDRQSGVSEY
jgi:hypothetical protein